uniref:Nbs-lrr resistance protein n=1 Tax=Solanum tuberosum TaxID=4113 RepID=M1DZM7_SOLTU
MEIALCCWNKRSMITPVDDQSRRAIDTMDANMLAELLQQVLESSRYFIVLVDIPDIVTWRALKYVFPVENCGSRVIIISRFDDMCHTICEDIPDSDVYSLNPLSEYESWELPFGIEHLRKLQSLVLQNISENMLMTVKLKDSTSGNYWKIAHIPDVNVIDMYKSWKVEEESNSKF